MSQRTRTIKYIEGKIIKELSKRQITTNLTLSSRVLRNIRNIDEDHHEFDHKPAESEVKKADFINAKMKKMRKESQGRKAVEDLNKAIGGFKLPHMNKTKKL